MRITRARLIGGALAVSAAAAILPVSGAVAVVSPPLVLLAEPLSPARLVAGGAALDVTVEYTCAADTMFVEIQATEKVGRRVASGFGFVQVPCDGASHTTVVRLAASTGGPAFARGTAAVRVSRSGCTPDFTVCGGDTVDRTVAVRR